MDFLNSGGFSRLDMMKYGLAQFANGFMLMITFGQVNRHLPIKCSIKIARKHYDARLSKK